jgi:putative PIN family toxin of toxin-antitoxin system
VLRAVVDTNVWVSAVLNPAGPPAAVLNAFADGKFELVASEPLLVELRRVLSRPRLVRRYQINPSDVDELVALLSMRAEIVVPPGILQLCRDPDDDIVIETAVVGRAGYVVTRDDDLKRAPEVVAFLEEMNIPVRTVRRFLSELADPA